VPAAPLSASQVSALSEPGVHRVDRGLYLQIRDNGARSWILRYQLNGRARAMGLGPARLLPLSDARARAIKAQRLLLDGIDPIDARRAERAKPEEKKVVTFAECATKYVEKHRSAWRNDKHVEQWSRTIETYANPTIGHLPVDEVTVDHVEQVLVPIWTTKSETAGRLRGRIEKVLGWAASNKLRSGENPARWKDGPLSHRLPELSKVQKIEHHAAIPYTDIPALMKELRDWDSGSSTALQFIVLTAARSGEARGATWAEIDRRAKLWTLAGDRMKAGAEHRVPLSGATMDLLPPKGAAGDFLFPGSRPGRPYSDMALLKALRKLRPEATVHGLRSSFSTWAAEQTDFPREIVEASLAHITGTDVERAYRRTDFADKRRELMDAWAAYCMGPAS